MKKLLLTLLLLNFVFTFSQNEKSPVFIGCENETLVNIESCFFSKVKNTVENEFKVPQIVKNDDYKGVLRVVFNVTKSGEFKVLYVNSIYPELENEARRVFKTLPKITPATYNGRAVEKQYILPLGIPIGYKPEVVIETENTEIKKTIPKNDIQDFIVDNQFPEHNSQLNIPFTHEKYDFLQFDLNKSANFHTAVKPYIYSKVTQHVDLNSKQQQLLKNKESWFAKKLWNEHLVNIKGNGFWFTIDPAFDVQVGKDNSDADYTYNNTRAIVAQGGLGKKFNFSTTVYESQGRFADYINDFNQENSIVLGRSKFKKFKDTGFDYPVAEGYISYTPNKFFSFQAGNGKNFIGDGYRSLFLSDVSAPYSYLKITTNFWKIKYTNLWMWVDDIRPEVSPDGSNLRKYVATHHLSYNVTKKLNIGLFESIITNNEDKNGFDVNFFNPIIFYRNVEFNRGSASGNAVLGLNSSYKWNDKLFLYSQFLLDELSVERLRDGNGYWANKFGVQAGMKYFDAFGIDNLYLQGEVNIVRPFTYAHRESTLNYGHFNQQLAHLWGANFWEGIGIARYHKNRWYANAKLVYGKKGFDFEDDPASYGGNIFIPYTERISDFGNDIAQGNKADIFIGDLQLGYLINPSTNLKLFAGVNYRDFSPENPTAIFKQETNTWITFGLKTDLFNWYFDF